MATDAEISLRAISVFPSGAGLPEGGTSAREGKLVYVERCAALSHFRPSPPALPLSDAGVNSQDLTGAGRR